MGEYYDQVPENIKDHIMILVKGAGKEDNNEYIEAISQGWIEKMKSFEAETALFQMEQAECFEQDNSNGALLLTYSGSLINIGPLTGEGRKVEYTSIGLRTDVPDKAAKEGSTLECNVNIDEAAEFEVGPIKKSSPIFKIAVMKEEVEAEDQEEKLAAATQVLADNFLEVNKTVIIED